MSFRLCMDTKKMLSIKRMLEKRAYWWVHIVEEGVKRLKQDENHPLLTNVYHECVKEKKKYRECHIYTHPEFEKLDPKMSIKCPPNTNLWFSLDKMRAVLNGTASVRNVGLVHPEKWNFPKCDGYTWMISALVSRDFGVGAVVNDEELNLINQRRQSDEWSYYV